jgi:methylenetetrahydrofolate--tRNA-(uracil-5-)-methyltransferase
MGILPELGERIRDKRIKYERLAQRGLDSLDKLIETL